MKIPLGPFTALGKTGYNLYCYFFKGAKIDASLKFLGSEQRILGASPRNPTDRPVYVADAINVFDFKSRYKLTVKNTSKNTAYNVRLINSNEIFTSHEEIEPLTSLSSGESISITCWFITPSVHAKGYETKSYHGIPKEKKNKTLIIAYDNEARITFYTKFTIDETQALNEYLLKLPKK
jgi:hypothetical protein